LKHLTDADIQAYLEDNLVDDARWVEDHTNACDTCRKRLAEYRALYLQLADDSALPVFDGLSDAVMARATRDGSSKERSGFVDVILAASGAVLVFVTFLFVSDISPLTAGLADLGRSAGSDAHLRNEIGRGYVLLEDFDGPESFLASSKTAIPGGRKTPPIVAFATWFRSFPAALADMRLEYRLTGRP